MDLIQEVVLQTMAWCTILWYRPLPLAMWSLATPCGLASYLQPYGVIGFWDETQQLHIYLIMFTKCTTLIKYNTTIHILKIKYELTVFSHKSIVLHPTLTIICMMDYVSLVEPSWQILWSSLIFDLILVWGIIPGWGSGMQLGASLSPWIRV